MAAPPATIAISTAKVTSHACISLPYPEEHSSNDLIKEVFLSLNFDTSSVKKEMCVATKTVENYRDSVYEKLDINSRHELVAKLNSMGFEA